jgi:hypothetical protein
MREASLGNGCVLIHPMESFVSSFGSSIHSVLCNHVFVSLGSSGLHLGEGNECKRTK